MLGRTFVRKRRDPKLGDGSTVPRVGVEVASCWAVQQAPIPAWLAEVTPDACGAGAVEGVLVVDAGLQEELLADAGHRGAAICAQPKRLFSQAHPEAPIALSSSHQCKPHK
jgi:hypothetical protein